MGSIGHVIKVMDEKAFIMNQEGEFLYISSRQGMYAGQVIQYEKKDIFKHKRTLEKAISIGGMVAVLALVFLYGKFLYKNETGNNGTEDKGINNHISSLINKNDNAEIQNPITPSVTVALPLIKGFPEDWENGLLNGWVGTNPKVTTEWAANGKYSMKDRIIANGELYAGIEKFIELNLAGRKKIKATMVVDGKNIDIYPNIFKAAGFVKCGSEWKWYNGEFYNLHNNKIVEVEFDLARAKDLEHVRSIGFQIYIPPTAKGEVSVYIDSVEIE